MRAPLFPTLCALFILLFAGCAQRPFGEPHKPTIITSFYPLYYFTTQLAGDTATVISLIPSGVEPHEWEPTPHNIIDVENASLFILNGAHFEPWSDRLIAEAQFDSAHVVVTSEGITLLQPVGDEAESGATVDPHIWLDPVLAQLQVKRISEALIRIFPENRALYEQNTLTLLHRLQDLDHSYQTGLANCTRKDAFVSHAAFGYLLPRYGIHQYPITGLAPESEPAAAHLAELSTLAKEKNVTSIFFETLVSPKLAESLSREVGARTLVLDPLEGITPEEQKQGATYFSVMQNNLKNLQLALGCG